jgi:hypothetical protein
MRAKFCSIGGDKVRALGHLFVNHRGASFVYNEIAKEILPTIPPGTVVFADLYFPPSPITGANVLHLIPQLVADKARVVIRNRGTGWRPNSSTGVRPRLVFANNRFVPQDLAYVMGIPTLIAIKGGNTFLDKNVGDSINTNIFGGKLKDSSYRFL